MPPALVLSFGPFRLDMANAQLWCETHPVRLTAKALQVLSYLAERSGQLVTKDELFEAVWPDTVVSDATLTSNIQAVRQGLGDDSRSPQYIETVHRRGFRFIGKVVRSQEAKFRSQNLEVRIQEEENQKPVLSFIEGGNGENPEQANGEMQALEPPLSSPSSLEPEAYSLPQDFDTPAPNTQHLAPTPPAAPRLWPSKSLVLAAVLLMTVTILTVRYLSHSSLSTQSSALITQEVQLPLPDKPSLIVLPFVNLSNDPEQEYFSDGLTEVLTGNLSRISSLFVIARNSAFTYKGKAVKVQDVSKEMGVRYVLEGSVQKANQRIRIAVQLIDATTGYHLWSEQYDRPLTDLFTLQDEVVQKIVTTLQLQLTVREQGQIVRRQTHSLEAYDAFLRGVDYFDRFTKEANVQARQMWEKAIALDPQYAEAYEWLSLTYLLEWIFRWDDNPQTLERASALAQKAVALDDSLPVAHWGLSHVYRWKQQYEQAVAEGERAIALDPNNADSYYVQGEALNAAGRPEEALRSLAQAMRLNPRYPPLYLLDLGVAYRLTGRYTEAIATLQEAISRSPNFIFSHLELAVSYLLQWVSQQSPAGQRLEPAMAAIQQALALNDSLHLNHLVLGGIYLNQQQYEQALAEIERAVALAPTEAESYAALAMVLSCVGRTEEALAAAAQALRLKSYAADLHLADVGAAYAIAGRYEEARAPLQRYLSRYPNFLPAHLMLASVYSELGQEAEARAEAAEVLRINPHFSLELHKQRMPIKDPAVLERYIAALRKAGLK